MVITMNARNDARYYEKETNQLTLIVRTRIFGFF